MNPIVIAKLVGVGLFVGALVYVVLDFHYWPMKEKDKIIADQEFEIHSQEATIKELGIKITILIEENKVTGFEEYFKGLEDANNTNIDHTKFIF